ncbi:universal stress protein [Rhodobacteraceae bacterium 2376]|uniref:Universal stress protein n=1 Tax=Rhabdonatronobacter sediminivivens TaxID=2743469 RepID=A0A7Z0HZD9_9RHOB|nr:universal stress protein [Rhabdonatronobacter sediminivivens]NYS25108.1 universal stress protein [Rhabdonatronobacter sediminivivens]
MYDSIVVAAALFSKGATTRGLIEKAGKMLNPGGTITIVHVLDEIPAYMVAAMTKDQLLNHRKAVRSQLESLAATARGKQVEIDLRAGKPSTQILECARECKADLIMIASHKPGFSDYFIGSTAARVVRHSPVSVLVSRRFS